MIELYGMASPNVTKITIALHEFGLPFSFRRVNVFREEQFDPAFVRLNPNKKVPVLVETEHAHRVVIFESTAILIHLADKQQRLLPPIGQSGRSEVLKWLMLQATGFGPMCGQYVHFSRFAPEGNDYGLRRYKAEVLRLYKVFEERLGQSEWIGGDEYSIADIALYPWAALRDRQKIDWAGHDNLQRWFDAVSGRSAVDKAMKELVVQMAIDNEQSATASQRALSKFLNREVPVEQT